MISNLLSLPPDARCEKEVLRSTVFDGHDNVAYIQMPDREYAIGYFVYDHVAYAEIMHRERDSTTPWTTCRFGNVFRTFKQAFGSFDLEAELAPTPQPIRVVGFTGGHITQFSGTYGAKNCDALIRDLITVMGWESDFPLIVDFLRGR